jgi:3-hydroxybutyryl-CoA dehydratase
MARLSYDDIEVGRKIVTLRRTVTEADIVNFAGLSGDFNPLHTDEQWVREQTPFRGRIAHGLLSTALASGLQSEYAYDWDIVAYLECLRRFQAPVYPGDTIQARYEVTDKRASKSNPETGVVSLEIALVNQDEKVVQSGRDVVLMARRGAAVGGEAT